MTDSVGRFGTLDHSDGYTLSKVSRPINIKRLSVHGCHSGRIVSPAFEPSDGGEKNGESLSWLDVANDPTHVYLFFTPRQTLKIKRDRLIGSETRLPLLCHDR